MERLCVACLLMVSVSLPSEGHPCGDGGPCPTQTLDGELTMMFYDFMKTYGKIYKDQKEETHRFKIFVENLERAKKLQEEERGTAEYGVTKFSDLSEAEFKGGSVQPDIHLSCHKVNTNNQMENLPDSKDWRDSNSVTNVKDQGKTCNSCWAFAVVANVESQWAIKTKKLISLSSQEVLDCAEAGNCSCGYIDVAFKSLISKGLMSEEDYKYKATIDDCHINNAKIVVKVKSCEYLVKDETAMKQYVALNGTITTLVNPNGLKDYNCGIIKTQVPSLGKHHAVLIVGYGVESKVPYWIVKNSWGKDWGEEGYFRIYRGGNIHGIAEYPMTATV
ncbi:cathepsin F-like isoform X2 [Carcharodon carcharias]|uniref:cathepsin F-like isoform X2 n=1 Tax=Carcharodon carcharias TaxID=13397 RepID=UPI001B7D9679|nr:cathepsin F-like isoform X2 [Carcharodon carcharias]